MRVILVAICLLTSVYVSATEIQEWVKLAESGNSEAMYNVFVETMKLGSHEHPVPEREIEKAKYWLLKAGENNNWRAAYVLQLCYEKGCMGLPIDSEKSVYYKNIVAKFGPNSSFKQDQLKLAP